MMEISFYIKMNLKVCHCAKLESEGVGYMKTELEVCFYTSLTL